MRRAPIARPLLAPLAPLLRVPLALLLPAVLACGPATEPVVPPAEARVSILAVGDTGQPPERDPEAVRIRVGRALAAEDRRLPAHALVLLGDNFYPKGLLGHELVPRIRENLVRPYCHFLRLDGPRSAEVADGCSEPAEARHPIPILAVLGNHDHYSDESPGLQQREVPAFVPAFQLHEGWSDVRELEGGVSLIRIDSQKIFHRAEERAQVLVEALRAARGPFRIVAAHHPPLLDEGSEDAHWARAAEPAIRRALAEAGVPVHLWLAGHEHNLQLVDGWEGGPALVAIAGAGSDPRSVRPREGARFARSTPGFARVDLVREASGEALVVTLFDASSEPPRAVARQRVPR